MKITLCADPAVLGRDAAECIRRALAQRGAANITVATGASQIKVLGNLVAALGIDWTRVTGFHLDEYIGLPRSHPASFWKYLKERLVDRVPMRDFYEVDGEADPVAECRRLGQLMA
jgi:glucosamine-6-phosphate deaminase